ncbi:MAG: hypothetical protein IT494_01095 [Gammaproteobacteria bacterium]|nr:hypothetical protein [Gammaproteobacteria bacterium]
MSDGGVGAVLLAALAGELALHHLLGLEPLQALTRRLEVAAGLAVAILLVAPLIGAGCYLLLNYVLQPARAGYLAVPACTLLAFGGAHGVGLAVRAVRPAWREWARLYPPLLAVNGTVLGVALVTLASATTLPTVMARASALACGYSVLLIVIAQLRERLAAAEIPVPFRDLPALLIALSILAMGLSALC